VYNHVSSIKLCLAVTARVNITGNWIKKLVHGLWYILSKTQCFCSDGNLY